MVKTSTTSRKIVASFHSPTADRPEIYVIDEQGNTYRVTIDGDTATWTKLIEE